jgi:hypothetical protein
VCVRLCVCVCVCVCECVCVCVCGRIHEFVCESKLERSDLKSKSLYFKQVVLQLYIFMKNYRVIPGRGILLFECYFLLDNNLFIKTNGNEMA